MFFTTSSAAMSHHASNTNNSAPPFSVADVEKLLVAKLWPAILYTSLMMLMGSVGNSIVCYVYGFRWQSTVTKTFIFSLAGLDLLNSLICMPTEIAILVRIVSFDVPAWCKITRFLTYTLNGSSSLILVSIALDRWYKVCRPVQCFFTDRRAKMTCAGAVAFAASLSWPSLILYGSLTIPVMGTGNTGVMCLVSDDYIDTWWPLVFYSVYFSCYLCLVVAIVVLYSLIAARLVQLKKQQKERIAAKYSALRSSKLMFPSQESIPIISIEKDHPSDTCGSVNLQEKATEDCNDVGQAPTSKENAVSPFQRIQEDNERRRSVTFRLPRKSTTSEDSQNADVPAKKSPNGVQLPAIVIDNQEKIVEEEPGDEEEIRDEEGVSGNSLVNGQEVEEYGDLTDESLTQNLLQNELSVDQELRQSTDSLQSFPDNAKLLSGVDTSSYTGSHDDTDEFEQGIHFVVDTDITWQHNPIADADSSQVQIKSDDADVKHSNDDISVNETGSKSSLLSEKTKLRVQQTKSDSFALLSVGQVKDGRGQKPPIHKTSSDSNLYIPEKNQGMTSARRSFLMPPGGYPGGHTPTSRLPTPTDSPGRGSHERRSVQLSNKLLLERLNKKMAYRPAKTTRMLFAISIVFVVSFLPFFCIVIVRAAQGTAFFASLSNAGVILVNIFIRSSFISNAANPIIYGLCNKQFRTECRHLIGRCHGRRRGVNLRVIEATDDALASNS